MGVPGDLERLVYNNKKVLVSLSVYHETSAVQKLKLNNNDTVYMCTSRIYIENNRKIQ